MANLDKPLSLMRARILWEAQRFTTGDCHTLAMALHEADGRTGTLLACLYGEASYSHMVLVDANGNSWDITGDNAQQRWQAKFTRDCRWVAVPCAEPDYKDTKRWLRKHSGRINSPLQRKLVHAFTAF